MYGPGTTSYDREMSINPLGRLGAVIVDCHDLRGLAEFWQQLVGGELVTETDDWVALRSEDSPELAFQRVDEPKSIKNRLHLDITVDDLFAATATAELLGAMRVGDVVRDPLGPFQVMTDPEGNEFCFVTS